MRERKNSTKIGALVLAAGNSSRFGSNKLLFKINGKSVLERTLLALSGFKFWKTAVVVSNTDFDDILGNHVEKILNKQISLGIGKSIALGTIYLREEVSGILIVLADQPLLTLDDIKKMTDVFLGDPTKIVACSVDGEIRNPIIFPSGYFDELIKLSGDRGARGLANSHIDNIVRVEVDSSHLLDIDSIQDVPIIIKEIERG
ncbi:MAG: nucleotidyltransferase family protein [Candidatus Thermoplasmatota archaeon]|nr:nucleotidyltransferase family protein [Candidatus Thermoplasmatota archaeon]